MINLWAYKNAKELFEYLKRVHNQDNTTRRFLLELEISKYSQGNKSIPEYYSGFTNLWSEFMELVYTTVQDFSTTIP